MTHGFNLLDDKFPSELQSKQFHSLYELKRYLISEGISASRVEEIAKHEKAHYDTAKELGYNPIYGCMKLLKECYLGPIKFVKRKIKACVYIDETVNEEDILKIASAPEDLSDGDILKLQQLNQKP